MDQNRKRGLSDVAAVEAWHADFESGCRTAALYIDVVFQTGRLGGNPKDRVRFKLGLKRAEIIVVIPKGEPARVDVRSVVRDSPTGSGEVIQKTSSARRTALGGHLGANLGIRPKLAGSMGLEAATSGEREQNVQITETISHIKVVHMKNDDQMHRWLVKPTISATLDGRPWDSKNARLELVDTRHLPTRAMAASIRVDIQCMIEDLEITDISLKDQNLWRNMVEGPNHRNKIAAAEAYIRNRLYRDGLIKEELLGEADKYARITIASTIAEC